MGQSDLRTKHIALGANGNKRWLYYDCCGETKQLGSFYLKYEELIKFRFVKNYGPYCLLMQFFKSFVQKGKGISWV